MLHLDLNLREWMDLVSAPTISGFTRSGERFTAELSATFGTNGRVTVALDDLVVGPWEDHSARAVENGQVRAVFAFFEPRAVDDLFFRNLRPVSWSIDGEGLASTNLDLIDHYQPSAVPGTHWGLSLTTKSALYADAAASISRSPQERLCLVLRYDTAEELATSRRHVSALQTLIEAVGSPQPRYLRELSLLLADPDGGSDIPADWWASSLLRHRGALHDTGPESPRIPRTRGDELTGIGLDELGGLLALQRWVLLCETVPHLLSVLDSHHRGLTVDSRASVLSLAVGWEHLAARSRGAAAAAAWREIANLLRDGDDTSGHTEQMIELCWNTYLKIKHVELSGGESDARATIADDDRASLDLAAQFMHHTVLAAAFTLAGIPVPGDLERRIYLTEFAEEQSPWTRVVSTYLNA